MDVLQAADGAAVRAAPTRGLAAAGALFGLVALGLLIAGANLWACAVLAAAGALVGRLSTHRRQLARLRRRGEGVDCNGHLVDGAKSLLLRWACEHDAQLQVVLVGSRETLLLFSNPDVSEALASARAVAETLELEIVVDDGARLATLASAGRRLSLAPSSAHKRAERATRWGAALLALDVGFLTAGYVQGDSPLHPLSVGLALLGPALLILLTLMLAGLERSVLIEPAPDGKLIARSAVLSRKLWQRQLSKVDLRFVALRHSELGLAYVWLNSDRGSLLLNSDAESIGGVCGALVANAIPSLTKDPIQ